jgi:diaminopimelate epimerase
VPSIAEVPFAKYHAAGNDFIVVSAADLGSRGRSPESQFKSLQILARAILDRHIGVGADGLFVVSEAQDPKHHAAVRIFNADGSEAEMSGNGIRCAAASLLEAKPKLKRLAIETAAGVKIAELVGAGPGRGGSGETTFRIAMGKPILNPKRIPFHVEGAGSPVIRYPLPTSIGEQEVTVTSMGNPHCSMFVDCFDDFDWRALGREIERHPLFPNRTNIEFIRAIGRKQIEVRFWERGVGETASSGTGSSAAAVASVLNGLTGRRVKVNTPGGTLDVEWSRSNQVFLTGPVRRIARGKFDYCEPASSESISGGRARRSTRRM